MEIIIIKSLILTQHVDECAFNTQNMDKSFVYFARDFSLRSKTSYALSGEKCIGGFYHRSIL